MINMQKNIIICAILVIVVIVAAASILIINLSPKSYTHQSQANSLSSDSQSSSLLEIPVSVESESFPVAKLSFEYPSNWSVSELKTDEFNSPIDRNNLSITKKQWSYSFTLSDEKITIFVDRLLHEPGYVNANITGSTYRINAIACVESGCDNFVKISEKLYREKTSEKNQYIYGEYLEDGLAITSAIYDLPIENEVDGYRVIVEFKNKISVDEKEKYLNQVDEFIKSFKK